MTNSISNIIDLTNAPTPPRWFEFLLEPGRLQHHLESSACDPSPTQLINLFFRNMPTIETSNGLSPSQKSSSVVQASTNGNSSGSKADSPTPGAGVKEDDQLNKTGNDLADKLLVDLADSAEVHIPPDSYEAKYRTKKAYALQTLALQVASYLKWDLDTICDKLTIPVQYKLMQALTNACSSKNCLAEVQKFSEIIYQHWFLRSAITYQVSALQPQSNCTTIIYLSQLQQQQQAAESLALSSMGELFAPASKQLRHCCKELHAYICELVSTKESPPKKAKTSWHPFKKAKLFQPMMECFDSRDEQLNDWNRCETIESDEFIEGACYDLGRFFFFVENYAYAKQTFEIIKESTGRFPKLKEYLDSAAAILEVQEDIQTESDVETTDCDIVNEMRGRRKCTEDYLFECMTEFSKRSKPKENDSDDHGGSAQSDTDLRFARSSNLPNAAHLEIPACIQQQQLLEVARGDVYMSQGNFKQAMGCFVGALMLMTDYFRTFSKGYVEEEPYITRMIQCSISLSCFTQAVALCQMTRNLNYTIAFKQLNERICNDCCDDIYECIWNVTLLEYIINLHSKRGEVERRAKVIQLIGQLELNENNPEEVLSEAEHVRRGRFFRILSNKYL